MKRGVATTLKGWALCKNLTLKIEKNEKIATCRNANGDFFVSLQQRYLVVVGPAFAANN